MIIGIPKEIAPGERRVACTPTEVTNLRKLGYEVMVESGAGMEAGHSDRDYIDVKANAAEILKRLKSEDRTMPPVADDGPWPEEWITLFERWINEGTPA